MCSPTLRIMGEAHMLLTSNSPFFASLFVCGYVILWTRAAVFEEFDVPVWFIGPWNFRFCIRRSFGIPSCEKQIS